MAEAHFNENLYGGSAVLAKQGGAGLIAFCDSFYFERHARMCEPGKWHVGVVGTAPGDFWPLLTADANAVVDDFGTLVKVQ